MDDNAQLFIFFVEFSIVRFSIVSVVTINSTTTHAASLFFSLNVHTYASHFWRDLKKKRENKSSRNDNCSLAWHFRVPTSVFIISSGENCTITRMHRAPRQDTRFPDIRCVVILSTRIIFLEWNKLFEGMASLFLFRPCKIFDAPT